MTTIGQGSNPNEIFEWDGSKKVPIATPGGGGGGGIAEQVYAISSGESAQTLNAGTNGLTRAQGLVVPVGFTMSRMGIYIVQFGAPNLEVAVGVYDYSPGDTVANLVEQSDYTEIQNLDNGQALPNSTPGARIADLRNPVALIGEDYYLFALSIRTNGTSYLSLDNRLSTFTAPPVFAVTANSIAGTEMNPTLTVDPSSMPGPNGDNTINSRIWMIGLST